MNMFPAMRLKKANGSPIGHSRADHSQRTAQIDFSVLELSKNVRFHMEPSLYETSRIVILGAKIGSFAEKW